MDKELFFRKLFDADNNTIFDDIKANQDVFIRLERSHGKIKRWEIIPDGSLKKKKRFAKGKTMENLEKKMTEIMQSSRFDYDYSVMCLIGASYQGNNRYIVKFINIEKTFPFDVDEDEVTMPVVKVILSEKEYAVCRETGIAFYDEVENIIFPVKQDAAASIGRYMDMMSAFNHESSAAPLGPALMMAERLSKVRGLKIVYLNGMSDRCKPVVAVVSGKFIRVKHSDFFKGCFNYLETEFGLPFEINSWDITDDQVTVNLIMHSFTGIDFLFSISNGFRGISTSLDVYALIGKAKCLIDHRVMSQSRRYDLSSGIHELLDAEEIKKEINEFESEYTCLDSRKVVFKESFLKDVKKNIGLKRYKQLNLPAKDTIVSASSVVQIITAEKMNMGFYQAYRYAKALRKLIKCLAEEEKNGLEKC